MLRRIRGNGKSSEARPKDASDSGDRRDRSLAPRQDPSSTTARGEASAPELSLKLSPAKVARALFLVVSMLVLLSFVNTLVGLFLGPVVRLFAVAYDVSLPAWYSSLALLLASVLLTIIALVRKSRGNLRYVRRWALLAAIFFFLSCDEMLGLHESMAIALLQPALASLFGYEPTGILYYSWVIVYVPLVLIFALMYLRFWVDLPSRVRTLFLASGTLFIAGSVGVEMFNSWYESTIGASTVIIMMTHVEELLEMLGVVVFIYALMSYLSVHLGVKELRIRLQAET